MKKNLIYTVTFLLCGAFFFSSCEDMLNVESNRVEYEFEGWTFNDSVYSVLGILKSVQKVGDRHILLNELRGDLLATNSKTLDDVLDISKYNFDVDNNEYLNVKDYFSIINNCNVFLARVDTTLEYDNRRLMLREYVAVKSVRAWTYMQLMKNHAYVPYFTEPVLKHSKAEEIMAASPADHITIINNLIEDLARFEDPTVYKMPLWEIPNFVDKSMTGKLFMPIRVLLGDLYLWRAALKAETATYPLPYPNPNSDYAKAAEYYCKYLTEDNMHGDTRHTSTHLTEKPDDEEIMPSNGFLSRFVRSDLNTRAANIVSLIHYADNENVGLTSELASVFAPIGDAGQNQVVASPALAGVSARQVYVYRYYKTETSFIDYIVNSKKWPGDLRLYSVTAAQRGTDINKTLYNNMILKFNVNEVRDVVPNMDDGQFFYPENEANNIILDRPEHIYLRFAEALLGLEREGWSGAKELAMTVLKSGVKEEYKLYWKPQTVKEQATDKDGELLFADMRDKDGNLVKLDVPVLDENNNPVVDEETNEPLMQSIQQKVPVVYITKVSEYKPLVYDFSDNVFSGNEGIHSRGSGFTEANPYYALTDSCVAQYHNQYVEQIPAEGKIVAQDYEFNDDSSIAFVPRLDEAGEFVVEDNKVLYDTLFTEPVEIDKYNVTDQHRLDYMYDKLIDEMALEMAWEGHRFGDLARMAIALGNVDFLAKRVAARNVKDYDWRDAQGKDGWDDGLYAKLSDKNNWYIPLPEDYLSDLKIESVTPDPPYIPGEDDKVAPETPENPESPETPETPDSPDAPSVDEGGDTSTGDEQTPVAPEQGEGE